MAAKGARGSYLLEVLIILLALLLVAVIVVPNTIWGEEDLITTSSRNNMNSIYEAELFYHKKYGTYTDSLTKLLSEVQADSGLKQRQMLVSLTQSFMQVINNILSVPSIEMMSNISKASFEITGDLMGNERYFRKYENIANTGNEIVREIIRLDSSSAFPNFSRTKLFVDSLRDLKESVTDYPLQIAIIRAISAVDSLKLYNMKSEKEAFYQFWKDEYSKISKFISDIRQTDISKVSTVPDRLKKFIDQINTSSQSLTNATLTKNDNEHLEVERQNLTELHQKFLSPEFFMLTKRYSLTTLNEIDSILINLSQDEFFCPDAKKTYIIDTTRNRLTVECPNLLDKFHENFLEDIEPIRNLTLFGQIEALSEVLKTTKLTLDTNRAIMRRNTDILLKIKELLVEMDQTDNVFFYRYAKELHDFINLIDKERKISVIKPAIEDILNPMDTLANRIERVNVADLERRLNYYQEQLTNLDSAIASSRLSRSARRDIRENAAPFRKAFEVVSEIKNQFDPSHAKALKKASKSLENSLLHALEGESEIMYGIFRKKHTNHGYIKWGEMSWEEER
jgi:hypothetical protein